MIKVEQLLELTVDFTGMTEAEISREIASHTAARIADARRNVEIFNGIRDKTLLDNLIEFCHTGR